MKDLSAVVRLAGSLIISCGLLFACAGGVNKKEARAYLAESLHAIVTDWDAVALIERASDSYLKYKDEDENRRVFDFCSRSLGATRSFEESNLVRSMKYTDTSQGEYTALTFSTKVHCEKGDAEITTIIAKQGDAWKIFGFRVNSDAFLRVYDDTQKESI